MNKYYRPQYSFKQYKPAKSKWSLFLNFIKKRRKQVPSATLVDNNFRINPYKNKKERGKISWRVRISVVLLFVTIVLWVVALLCLPYFRISKIVYLGLDFIKKDDIDGFIKNDLMPKRWIFSADNYFLVSTFRIEKELLKKYSLNSVEVKAVFPNQLRIDLDEKISTIIYDNGFQYYLLDEGGGALKFLKQTDNPETLVAPTSTALSKLNEEIVDAVTSTAATSTTPSRPDAAKKTHIPEYKQIAREFGNYPVLYDMRNLSITEQKDNILTKNFIASIITWREMMEKEGVATVQFMTMEHPMAGVLVYTDQPWNIYFQPANDLERQMKRLKAVLDENKINEYVDLRFDDRVFWK